MALVPFKADSSLNAVGLYIVSLCANGSFSWGKAAQSVKLTTRIKC